jgi:hypothetical protein
MEHCYSGSDLSYIKYILFALAENVFLGLSKSRMGPSITLISLNLPLTTLVGIAEKRKRLTCTQIDIKVKLE